MSTIQEFENAPVGATATAPNGIIALKTGRRALEWVLYDSHGKPCDKLRSEKMEGFTLNPTAPTNSREALDLAWELAHPVEVGQTIPSGVVILDKFEGMVREVCNYADLDISKYNLGRFRTRDPLPEPEPDWLNAPAVLATCGCRGVELWHPHDSKDGVWVSVGGEHALWSSLREVTPLYPKETK